MSKKIPERLKSDLKTKVKNHLKGNNNYDEKDISIDDIIENIEVKKSKGEVVRAEWICPRCCLRINVDRYREIINEKKREIEENDDDSIWPF